MTQLEAAIDHLETVENGTVNCGCDLCKGRRADEDSEIYVRRVLAANNTNPDAEYIEDTNDSD